MAEGLVVQPIAGLLPLADAREPVRALVASLAPGGAERIVIEWLAAESARGRGVELAVLHPRRIALAPPAGAAVRVRGRESPEAFLDALAADWRAGRAPVSTHLVPDDLLGRLWVAGVRTVPVVHNSRAGWRNDPARWDPAHVPQAVACAESVRREMIGAGCRVPILAIHHRPRVGPRATDSRLRRAIRADWRVGSGTFLVAAIGAIKPQKDHARALAVLAALVRQRDAVLAILGGLLEPSATPELDRVLAAAVRLGVADRLRLPGFVADIEPWLAASDALLNVSRFEGLSIAVQEALAAGLPVVAADVGGQGEIAHAGLELLAPDAPASEFASRLTRHPVRATLAARPFARAPRVWSLSLAPRRAEGVRLDTLFVTANLNAGGAQRSLVNLVGAIAGRHRLAVAVCGDTTHGAYARALAGRAIECFRAASSPDDFAVAESLLAHAASRGVRTLCFWNVAPGVKLLAARFARRDLRLVDVSPGRYAFEELEGCRAFAESIGQPPEAYYARLNALVLKHDDPAPPPAPRIVRIANGVAARETQGGAPPVPRFLVSGRLAPSKRIDVIIAAFVSVRTAFPDAELHVFGVAEARHAACAASLQGAPGVSFRGASFELGHLAEAWTAAVVLGVHQGCPNAVLEAMSASIPVIANASGGTADILDAGRAGWLLPAEANAAAVAKAMADILAHPAEAHERARRGRDRVLARHSMEEMARSYLDVLAAAEAGGREKMDAWTSASALPAQDRSPSAPFPAATP